MSFVVAAALGIALFVVAPVVAHLLKRGRLKEQDFPPAHLVPDAAPVARQKSRLQDRLLLAVRALLIAALAVLGATPLVRCSRVTLSRDVGASVALAIVLDDSLSMRARRENGEQRFALAIEAAESLLDSARQGDAVALVLAGEPARLALTATTDLAAARRALTEVRATDRNTDLSNAIQMARSIVSQLPQVDQRVVVLSDFAAGELRSGSPGIWAPLETLREAVDDCGIVLATQRASRINADVACSSEAAAENRTVALVTTGTEERPLATARLTKTSGIQSVALKLEEAQSGPFDLVLRGDDDNPHDDRVPVAPESSILEVAVHADSGRGAAVTGGPPILDQALEALDTELTVRPIAVLPEDGRELAGWSLLLIDDPGGLGPETRGEITKWLQRGGVALAFLGPSAVGVQLGSTLEPFARGAVSWETTNAKGLDPKTLTWLGGAAPSLSDLKPRGRANLEGALLKDARIVGAWDDQRPWAVERAEGRGLVITLGLPVSVEQSDFALRPGFLALLRYAVDEALRRTGPRATAAGIPWLFEGGSELRVTGPEGPLAVRNAPGSETSKRLVIPEMIGRYEIVEDEQERARVVLPSAEEITRRPLEPQELAALAATDRPSGLVDTSREFAWLLLGLFGFELVIRLLRARPWHRAGEFSRGT